MKFPPVEEQLAYIKKGASEIIRENELRDRLDQSAKTGKPLRVYAGFDPTAPDLHLGHTVLLRKMKHFQDLGHTVIFLIGDFTAMIGDPTGRNITRPPLSEEDIARNAATYLEQVYKILAREKTEIRRNAEWMGKFTAADFVRLAGKYTVSQMLEREDFHKRFHEEKPISMHEMLYPLVQGFDSFALQCDVQLGGTDQKFNLMVSREIARAYGAPNAEIVLTMPLLEGTDGVQKMSKSYGNYIGIAEPAGEMFGKIMSISDELMWRYWTLLTDLRSEQIDQLKSQVASGAAHPMQVKKDLALRVVADFHSESAAREAEANWSRQFQKHETPDELEEIHIKAGTDVPIRYSTVGEPLGHDLGMQIGSFHAIPFGVRLDKLLVAAGLAASAAEAGRKIKEGAVRIFDNVETSSYFQVTTLPASLVLRIGKRMKRVVIDK